jgi:serine/threonine protein kinase
MAAPAEFVGKRVGRFTIVSHLASGGMAELFIARQQAVGGFEKQLVLKMLQERYATNPRVLQMFLDEARLAAKLNHQNIVHVYDVDRFDGIHYIAMEYIHGETVTDIVRRSIASGGFLPMEHAVQIVADVAAGLAYAHERRDADGRVTRIVHRDVSPSNVLVTYEGITKIVDFGIARVQDQIREESGMRPGKMSYMSPEQVRGEISDHRADIYSLGIILYEITVGRRLWRGAPEVVMHRILEEQVPPPTYIRRGYPPALELIIMKALEKRASDRQQTAAELQHELLEFMEESGLKSGPRRLARYMKDLFALEGGTDISGLGTAGIEASDREGTDRPDPGPFVEDRDEDLDFDRRAPLMMRVEARPDDPAEFESGPIRITAPELEPVPSGGAVTSPGPALLASARPSTVGQPAVATGGAAAKISSAGMVLARASAAGGPMIAGAAALASPVTGQAAAGVAASPVPGHPAMASPVAASGAVAAAAGPDTSGVLARGGWRWLVLMAVIALGIVVFIAMR